MNEQAMPGDTFSVDQFAWKKSAFLALRGPGLFCPSGGQGVAAEQPEGRGGEADGGAGHALSLVFLPSRSS
jgi:hypothetical protein